MTNETARTASSGRASPGAPWLPLAAFLALWILGLAISTVFSRDVNVSGLLFVLLGASAARLATFTSAELRWAPRTSSLFWETAARNAWIAGVTGSILFFVRAVGEPSTGIAEVARAMALSFVPSMYGLLVGALCLVRALRLRGVSPGAATAPAAGGRESVLGPALYAVLLVWTIALPHLGPVAPRLTPWDFVFYWPSILVVLGATRTLLWIAGGALRGRIAVASLALAGTIASLVGLVVALLGLADRSLERVTSGLGFMVTACFVALAGMTLFANPAEDRRARRGEPGTPSPWSRTAWLLFPLIAILVLVVTMVLVMTPMTRKL